MKSFRSRYTGTCCFEDCPRNRIVNRGEMIVWNRAVKGQVAHDTCFNSHGGTFPTLLDETKESAPPTNSSTDLAAAIASAITPLIGGKVDAEQVRAICQETITEALDGFEATTIDDSKIVELIQRHSVKRIEVVTPNGEVRDVGQQHAKFETLMKAVSAKDAKGHRLNIWLAGPAGTGKTTAAETVGKALGFERIVVLPKLSESYPFFGYFIPGTGEYKRTPARDVWEHGGMLVMDDFDGTDANIATELNAPLANGLCMFPDGMVPRHKDCVIILTANTWGQGATNEYVGRLKQDAAFLNRFVTIEWPIDEELERATVGNADWVKRVQHVRRNVQTKGIKVLITPRQSYFGAALLATGMDQTEVEHMTLRSAMTPQQWSEVQ